MHDMKVENVPFLAKQLKCRTPNRRCLTWAPNIPDCNGDLGIKGQITVFNWKRDPFIPSERKLSLNKLLAEN